MEFLGLASFTLTYVIAALLALSIPLVILLLSRHVAAGYGLVVTLFLVETIFLGMGPVQIGVNLYLQDIATGLLALAAFLRFLLVSGARPRLTIWYIFLGAVCVSLTIGLGRFGSGAGVAARSYFYAVAVTSYVITFPATATMMRQVFAALSWLGVAVLLVTIVRWIIVFAPLPEWLPEGGRYGSTESSVLRVIKSDEAVLLAQLLVIGLFFPNASVALRRLYAFLPLLFIGVVMLQHRSVWVACMAGLGARFLLRTGGGAIKQLAAIAVVTAAVIVPLTMTSMFGEASSDIAHSAGRALAGADTAEARLSSWQQLVSRWYYAGPQSIAIGQPFGTNMERYGSDSPASQKNTFQAHNFYVQTLVNTGLVGLLAIVLAYAWTAVRLYRLASHPVDGPNAAALFLLLVMQAVYYVPYGVDYLQGMVLGTAMAYALRSRREPLETEFASANPALWSGTPVPSTRPEARWPG